MRMYRLGKKYQRQKNYMLGLKYLSKQKSQKEMKIKMKNPQIPLMKIKETHSTTWSALKKRPARRKNRKRKNNQGLLTRKSKKKTKSTNMSKRRNNSKANHLRMNGSNKKSLKEKLLIKLSFSGRNIPGMSLTWIISNNGSNGIKFWGLRTLI